MPDSEKIPAWDQGVLKLVDKLDVHRRGLRHKAVSVFAFDGDKTLLQRRALGKYHTPGLWSNSCCTHPQWDETSKECATRRIEEELGVIVRNPVYKGHVEYRADVGNGLIEHEEVDIFTVDLPQEAELSPCPEQVMDVRWVTLEELCREVEKLPEHFTPWLWIYLRDHKRMLMG